VADTSASDSRNKGAQRAKEAGHEKPGDQRASPGTDGAHKEQGADHSEALERPLIGNPLIEVIPLADGEPTDALDQDSDSESQKRGKSTAPGNSVEFPKIKILGEVSEATSSKELQESLPPFTTPAKFTTPSYASPGEFHLDSEEDLTKFKEDLQNMYKKEGQDGKTASKGEAPAVFDIIYMGSRPLKMVFHQNNLLLIDP